MSTYEVLLIKLLIEGRGIFIEDIPELSQFIDYLFLLYQESNYTNLIKFVNDRAELEKAKLDVFQRTR